MAKSKSSDTTEVTSKLIEHDHKDKDNAENAENIDLAKPTITANQKSTSLVLFVYNSVIVSVILSLLLPFFSKVALAKRVTSLQIGCIYAIYPLGKIIISPFAGMLMHKIGCRYTLWIGLFLEGGCTILFGFLPDMMSASTFVACCIIVRGFQGLGAGVCQVTMYGFVATTFKESAATVIGVLEVASILGLMVGPPVGGLLYEIGGYHLPFLVFGSILLLSAFITFCGVPSIIYEGSASFRKLMIYVMCLPRVMLIGLGLIVQMACLAFLEPSLSVQLKGLSLTTTNVGLIFLLLFGSYGLCAPLIGCVSDKTGHRIIIIIGCFVLGICLQFLGPAPYIKFQTSLVITILAVSGIGISIALATVPALPDILQGTTASGYCKESDSVVAYAMASGIFNSFYCLGQIIGYILGGAFGISTENSYRWCSGILGILAIIQGFILTLLTICERRAANKGPKPL